MSYYRLYYHAVWSTKYRRPLITEDLRDPIYGAIVTKAVDLGGNVYAVNGIEDHVHLVATIPPSIAVSNFIGQVKGVSSHLVGSIQSPNVPEPFYWQDKFSVFSLSERDLPFVIRYVQRQQEHHARNRLIPPFERLD